MWKDLSYEWQTVFDEAWEAFKNGSIPIGAAVFNENGNMLIREHNRGREADTVNKLISHAEANALRRLDTDSINMRTAVLYTTMEPCPMCMGTAVMSNIRHLRYAAHDPYCGCVYLKDSDPYMQHKGLDYSHTGGELEFVQLVIQSYHELKLTGSSAGNPVLEKFAELNGQAVMLAEELYSDKLLDKYADNGEDIAAVYDIIIQKAETKTVFDDLHISRPSAE